MGREGISGRIDSVVPGLSPGQSRLTLWVLLQTGFIINLKFAFPGLLLGAWTRDGQSGPRLPVSSVTKAGGDGSGDALPGSTGDDHPCWHFWTGVLASVRRREPAIAVRVP